MKDNSQPFALLLTGCCVAIIAALLVVGAVSSGVIRHIVQTSPLWIAIVLGVRRSGWSKWAALPCLVFWLSSVVGIVTALWMTSNIRAWSATATVLLLAVLQLAAFRLSLLPGIAH